jgi:hypothetical protein
MLTPGKQYCQQSIATIAHQRVIQRRIALAVVAEVPVQIALAVVAEVPVQIALAANQAALLQILALDTVTQVQTT